MPTDASSVTTRLWQGSAPKPGSILPFDVVVLTAAEHQYGRTRKPFGARAEVLRCPLRDRAPLSAVEVESALRAAVVAAHAYHHGKHVCITCAQGLNRSGLVMALTLLELGLSADDAVKAVRKARDSAARSRGFLSALFNGYFVQLVYAVAGRSILRIPVESQRGKELRV